MRLVRGRQGWWCLAPSGTALVPTRMVDRGRLTSDGREALRRTGITAAKPVTAYALTVLTTTACNLGCGYCFQNIGRADVGRSDPPRIARRLLDRRTTDAIAAFAIARMRAADVPNLYVLLFGGEPLLNPTGCLDLLRACRAAGPMSAGMVSNGTLLRPRLAARLHDLGLSSIQVTVDGTRPLHDGVRTTRNGRGTYDRVVAAVAAVQETTPIRFTLRVSVTPATLPVLDEVIGQLTDRVDARRCRLHLAPLTGTGPRPDELLDDLLDPVEETAARIVGAYRHALALGFRLPRPAHAACGFCGEPDGRLGAVVNADGSLFSCWESVGRPGFEVGDVDTGYDAYPPTAWVRCATADSRLADAVDAGLLDLLSEGNGDGHAHR